jgi:hypothetical protein
MQKKEQQTFGPLELPSGVKIFFRSPKGGDRVKVLQMLKLGTDNIGSGALQIDTLVAARCVTEYDGKAVAGDYKHLVDTIEGEDLDFFMLVYNEMFGMTEEKKDQAKERAAFLLGKGTSTDTSS